LKDATDAIFKEWWGDEMARLRRYFYEDFLRKRYPGLQNGSLKGIDDNGQIRQLMSFFDRVGWLGAAGLIDVDFVLGPMQHVLRRVWFATGVSILKERERCEPMRFDPVYCCGFQWLFERTEGDAKRQTDLLVSHFKEPEISQHAAENLWIKVKKDEEAFKQHLGELQGEDRRDHGLEG